MNTPGAPVEDPKTSHFATARMPAPPLHRLSLKSPLGVDTPGVDVSIALRNRCVTALTQPLRINTMERNSSSTKFPLGSALPAFRLKNVDGSMLDSSTLKFDKAVLVLFSCNHCPYVKGSEAMLLELARKYSSEGLSTLTINSNDPQQYPEDSFENMQKKSKEMKLPYPYLFDESQDVARAFDAACTPEAYLFNAQRKLVYHGALNDSHKDPSQAKKMHLATAVEQLLSGKDPQPSFVHPIGCSIKWR